MLDTNHDGVVSAEERIKRMEPMLDRLDTKRRQADARRAGELESPHGLR